MQRLLWKIQAVALILLFLSSLAIAASDEPHSVSSENVQQKKFSVQVNVDLVTTDVTVFGKPDSQLRADDFIVYDNDVAQRVSHFSLDLLPVAAALVVDSSAPVYQSLAKAALQTMKAKDRVVLFSFDKHPMRLSGLTEDRDLIRGKISEMKVRRGSNILDTIYDAGQYLKKNAGNRRRAVILISDACIDRCGLKGDARVEFLASGTAFYYIRVARSVSIRLYDCVESDEILKKYADDTGGEVLNARAEESFRSDFDNLMSNLRLQYTLGFNPSDPGKAGSWHKLMVRLAAPDHCPACRLKSRSGYYSSSSQ